ncbi:PCYCGC motif-containing (lipo)protein [Paenibacillus sp. GCM10027627]|uniref:PCYCGC motif-containing (lipo)protein n=1 Tax=unclassified Paenibacillus TaxID=185978 RepID=UPI00363D4346
MMNTRGKSPSPQTSSESGTTARSIMYAMLLGFALITLLAACGMSDNKKDGDITHHGSEKWQKTDSVTTLPGFLKDHTKLTSELYSEVHSHQHLLSGIPCYCGCMEGSAIDEAHDSLLRCYWAEHPADDGSVTWTDHSTGCGICKKEMEEVIALSKQGKTADEILEYINENYQPKKSAS